MNGTFPSLDFAVANFPLLHDLTDTPIASPATNGSAKEPVVPPSATHVWVNCAAGSTNPGTLVVKGQTGSITLGPGDSVVLPVAGMNKATEVSEPTTLTITPGATGTMSWAFFCMTSTGLE